MRIKTAIAAACLALASTTMTSASTVTVALDGKTYEVGTITGTFNDNSALILSQPFFGNDPLARALTLEVGTALGSNILLSTIGPAFALETLSSTLANGQEQDLLRFYTIGFTTNALARTQITLDRQATFATATLVSEVPLPAGAVLLISSLIGIGLLQRRVRTAA